MSELLCQERWTPEQVEAICVSMMEPSSTSSYQMKPAPPAPCDATLYRLPG
jgi:hypothetical protein